MEGRSAAEIVAKWPDVKRSPRCASTTPTARTSPRPSSSTSRSSGPTSRSSTSSGRSSASGLHALHQRPDGARSPRPCSRPSGAATSSPTPSRPSRSAIFDAMQVQLHRRRRGGLDRRPPSRWAPTTRSASGATPTTPSTGASPQAHKEYIGPAGEVHEGRVPVVLADPGLHRHAVPGRGHQEGQQHRLRQGGQGAARTSPSTRRSASRRSADKDHQANRGQFYGKTVMDPKYPFAIMKPKPSTSIRRKFMD